MKSILLLFAVAGLVIAGGASAQSGDEILKSKGCLGCHDFNKKKVGPAYKDIAAKYKGNKDAVGMLVGKIKGGKGHPKIGATDDELKAAVERVLSTK